MKVIRPPEHTAIALPKCCPRTLSQDLSTPTTLHETGHWALDTYARIAAAADAPPEIRADMARVLKWFGVESLEKWNA
jgi:hypothetical protein